MKNELDPWQWEKCRTRNPNSVSLGGCAISANDAFIFHFILLFITPSFEFRDCSRRETGRCVPSVLAIIKPTRRPLKIEISFCLSTANSGVRRFHNILMICEKDEEHEDCEANEELNDKKENRRKVRTPTIKCFAETAMCTIFSNRVN